MVRVEKCGGVYHGSERNASEKSRFLQKKFLRAVKTDYDAVFNVLFLCESDIFGVIILF